MDMMGSTYQLRTSDGTGNRGLATWGVTVLPGPSGEIVREVQVDGKEWEAEWHPEPTIWPTWSPGVGAEAGAGASLQGAHDYWKDAGDHLRDSAKWLAAVIGASLGALVGTSPLADIWQHRLPTAAYLVGAAGIVLLGVTLLLVLQVTSICRSE
jgi:hypothetical protein